MTRCRVLVIRPQPGADQTAATLVRLGLDPVVLPMTQTVALKQIEPNFRPNLVLATSPQVFRHLSVSLADAYRGARVLVTGTATAQAARDAGFVDVQATGGDVAALIQQLSNEETTSARVLYLAGRVRRPDLDVALAEGGMEHCIFEVYDTLSVSYSTNIWEDIAKGGHVDAVLMTSVESVVQLSKIAGTAALDQLIENADFICLSSRIAEEAKNHFRNACKVVSEPTEAALLRLLQATLNEANGFRPFSGA